MECTACTDCTNCSVFYDLICLLFGFVVSPQALRTRGRFRSASFVRSTDSAFSRRSGSSRRCAARVLSHGPTLRNTATASDHSFDNSFAVPCRAGHEGLAVHGGATHSATAATIPVPIDTAMQRCIAPTTTDARAYANTREHTREHRCGGYGRWQSQR